MPPRWQVNHGRKVTVRQQIMLNLQHKLAQLIPSVFPVTKARAHISTEIVKWYIWPMFHCLDLRKTLMSHGAVYQFNTLSPRQNGRHFPDDIFKWIFLNENVRISINMSLKFVLSGPISNIPTLVQVIAWRRPGDKPLSEPMMVRLPTHICVTRPQWVNRFYGRVGWFSKTIWLYICVTRPQWVNRFYGRVGWFSKTIWLIYGNSDSKVKFASENQ